MESKVSMPMTPFDEMVTSQELQIVKALIPYLSGSARKAAAACSKMMELHRAVTLFGTQRKLLQAQTFPGQEDASGRQTDLLDLIRPYLGRREQDMLDMFFNIRNMMEMVDMMKESSEESGFSPMDMAAAMLSPDQQDLFREYTGMFDQMNSPEHEDSGESQESE